MTEIEVIRLIAELLGVLVLVGGGITWLGRLTYRVLSSQAEIKHEIVAMCVHLQEMNGTVAKVRRDVDWLMGAQGRAPEQDS